MTLVPGIAGFFGQPPSGPPPGGWTVFGVEFTDGGLVQESDNILIDHPDAPVWPTSRTNGAGNSSSVGYVGPASLNGGTFSSDTFYGGFINGNLTAELVFRIAPAVGDEGSSYEALVSVSTLHSGSTTDLRLNADGGADIKNWSFILAGNNVRADINRDTNGPSSEHATAASWRTAIGTAAGRVSVGVVNSYVELRLGTNNSYARLSSFQLRKV